MVSSTLAGCNSRPHDNTRPDSGITSEAPRPLIFMTTTIPIDEDTRDKLRAQKVGSETYSEVIERLIQSQEAEA
jgi:hypothetical protein